jgi:hypothetical protein
MAITKRKKTLETEFKRAPHNSNKCYLSIVGIVFIIYVKKTVIFLDFFIIRLLL